MNEAELVRRVLALSPSQVKSFINSLNNKPPKVKPTSSISEELTSPFQECSNCEKMTVSQSSEDYHVLENSCPHLRLRKWDENSRRLGCKEWHLRRKTLTREEVEDGTDQEE